MRKENSDFHDLINIFENECCSCYLVLLAFLLFIFSFFRDKFVMVKTELVDDVMSTMFPSEVPIYSSCLPFFLSIYFYVYLYVIILSIYLSIYLSFHLFSIHLSPSLYYCLFLSLHFTFFFSPFISLFYISVFISVLRSYHLILEGRVNRTEKS